MKSEEINSSVAIDNIVPSEEGSRSDKRRISGITAHLVASAREKSALTISSRDSMK